MRIVISEDTNKFYRSNLLSIDSSMEIISLNPEDSTNPSWESIPASDAFFMSYQFLFAARDNPEIFDPLLDLSKRMKFIQSGFAGMDSPILLCCRALGCATSHKTDTRGIDQQTSGNVSLPIAQSNQ